MTNKTHKSQTTTPPTTESITKKIHKQNPLLTLESGKQMQLRDLDFNVSEQLNAYYDYFDEVMDAEETKHGLKAPGTKRPVENTPILDTAKTQTQSPEDLTKARIESLKSEISEVKQRMTKGFTAELFRQLDTKSGELSDLESRLRKEEFIKVTHRRRFLANSFGTPADFERLWPSMRDQALMDEVNEVAKLRRTHRHSLYNAF